MNAICWLPDDACSHIWCSNFVPATTLLLPKLSPQLTLPVPPCASALSQSKQHDVAAWGKACDNAHAQLEHQLNRITNLELLLKYGSNAWRAQSQLDEALLKQMEGTLQGLRK